MSRYFCPYLDDDVELTEERAHHIADPRKLTAGYYSQKTTASSD